MKLEVDWNYSENCSDKRRDKRLSEHDIVKLLFNTPEITVDIITNNDRFHGKLVNLSAGGMCVQVGKIVPESIVLRIVFYLDQKRIVTKGRVVRTGRINGQIEMDIMFIDLDNTTCEFLRSLYVAKVL